MSSIEIKSTLRRIKLEEVLNGISGLDTPDLEKFLAEVAHLLAQRKARTLPQRETELLQIINQKLFPEDKQEEYDELYHKLSIEQISPSEHELLLNLIQQREEKGVERMRCLVELAQLRKVSLKELMTHLGIQTLSDAA